MNLTPRFLWRTDFPDLSSGASPVVIPSATEYLANLQEQQNRQIAALTAGRGAAAAAPGTPPGTPPPLRGATVLPGESVAPPPAAAVVAGAVIPGTVQQPPMAAVEGVVPDPAIVSGLEAMGFAPALCQRAAVACNNASVETCMEWALAEGS